ncbi:MAG TPA: DUF1080 domain-containing protein [Acidobacteriota bacterium]|nr:DUF1080 domain-containing protein [Acidobacteriota bacterium]
MAKQSAKKIVLSLGLAAAICCPVWSQGDAKGGHPDTTGWKSLFAADLSNANFDPCSWVIENGVLSAKTGETIWTKDSYGNFILDLEFKVSKDANSGVFLRARDPKNVLSAFEIQIHESTDGTKYGMVGALYDAKPPSKNMAKPTGEWNRYTITCQDSKLSLVFNGERVLNVDLNDWTQAHKNPDGTPNKFALPLKDFSRVGPIGLQGLHGREAATVWFRNLKIKELR